MTSFSGDMITLSSDQERLRQIAGSQKDFVGQPGVALAMARSGADDSQIAAVGGFLRGLQLDKEVTLARTSGVKLNFSPDDRASMVASGVRYQDVDQQYAQQQQDAADQPKSNGGFLGIAGRIINHATGLPGVRQGFSALDRAADIGNTLYRESNTSLGIFGGMPSKEDLAERVRDMQAQGYNPESALSMAAFASRGKQVFHNLDGERQQYGVDRVRLAQEYLIDPENFMSSKLTTDDLIARDKLRRDPQFEQIVNAVDAKRRSPGRDVANGFGLQAGSKPYTVISGSTDAAWAFAYDPTLILGKVRKGAQVLRYGIGDFSDAGRVRDLMTGNASVRRGWTAFLDDAKTMKSGTPEEQAAAFARVRSRSGDLLPLVEDVHGGGFRNGKPIDTYDELVDHITGTPALVRMRNGLAADAAPLMPGAVSRWAARRAQVAGKFAARGEARTIDLNKDAAKVKPDKVDAVRADGSDATGLPDAEGLGDAVFKYRKTIRGRVDKTGKLLQTGSYDGSISLTKGAEGAETIRRFATLYMPAGHAAALAARFLVAPIGERRAIAEAVDKQVMHSAGIPSTKGGSEWMAQRDLDRVQKDNSAYDSSGKNGDMIQGVDGEATRRTALYDSQTNTAYELPGYRPLLQAAAKVSIYEHTLGSALDTKFVNHVQTAVRTFWLWQPAGAQRNAIDNNLSAWSQGIKFSNLATARLGRSSVQAQRILGAAKAKAVAETGHAERADTRSLAGVWFGAAKAGVRRLEAATGQKVLSDRFLDRVREVATDHMHGELEDLAAGTRAAGINSSMDEARGIMRRGYHVTQARMRVGGYELGGVDGANGAKLWANELNKRLSTPLGVKVFEAVTGKARAALAHADDSLPEGYNPFKEATEKVAPGGPPVGSRDALVEYMLSPEFGEGRAMLERFATLRDGTKVDEADEIMVRKAAEELADDQITDMKALLSDPGGKLNDYLVNHLSTGRASMDALSRVADKDRPIAVVQPKYVPDLSEGNVPSNIIQAVADAGYHYMVAGPTDWMSTNPIYTVNYAKAYDRVENWFAQVHPEFRDLTQPPPEIVAKAKDNPGLLERWHEIQQPLLDPYLQQIREVARQHAMEATGKMVDNPRIQSQLALSTRNLFNFYRAQEDFIRRWSRNLKESPENLRKMQLAVEGGMHMGLVYPDENGELVFAYPGSGAAIQGVAKALSFFGLGNSVNLPVMPNLSSKLTFLSPGLDRPFLPTTSPVASIPLRVLKHVTGDQVGLIQGQALAEGEISTNRAWWQAFLPTFMSRPLAAMSADELEGQYASAARNALLNGQAAHALPSNATPDQVQEFKDRVRIGVRNHLGMRALLGMLLPAAPSSPSEESDASRTNKIERGTFHSMSLRDEFRAMANKYGYQRAMQVWSETRPDELIYTVGTTEGRLGTGGNLTPTAETLQWMKDNPELVKNFGGLAAYFAPDAPGDFSADAWRAELELGLRKHKNLDDFYRDVAVKNAETKYYQVRDSRNAAIARAQADGDDAKVSAIKQKFSDWATEFKQVNPLLEQKWADTQASQSQLQSMVQEIQDFAASPAAAKVDPNGDLSKLYQVYEAKQKYDQTHKGRTAEELAGKDAVEAAYTNYVTTILTRSPYLQPIYQGVFDKVE